jgi:hypothetical protein
MTSEELLEEMINDLRKNAEVLTVVQAQVIQQYKPAWARDYLFYQEWTNTYLNLWVYSEAETDAQQLLQEQGL